MSIDAEWGLAMRVENTPQYPYAITLGALPESKKRLGLSSRKTNRSRSKISITYNLAP
jgi:hypothetical protein